MSARTAINALVKRGFTAPEIARQLDLAPATVRYHIGRLTPHRPARSSPPQTGGQAVHQSPTRILVARLLEDGISRSEIAQRLGVSKPTVSYHARRLQQPIDHRCARRYDWDAVQRYYDAGRSVRDCIEAFGFSSASWNQAVKRGALVARPGALPIEQLLVEGTYRGRFNLKLRLLREGLKENRCERCGVSEWHGQPLTLALHHVNGQRNDNRLENLELLCPNCHSQTENFAGRNGRVMEPRTA